MADFFRNLLSTEGFVARRACGFWSNGHIWLHTLSDLLIWLAYLSIPLILGFFLWRRRASLPFPWLIGLFAAFIFCCGTTHLLDAVMFDWPAYRLSGLMKGVTAVVSWLTVAALVPAVPRLLRFLDSVGPPPPPPEPEPAAGRPQRYVVAAGLAGLALLTRFAADGILSDGRGYVLPLLAVMAAAWYGGFGPGLLALVLGGGGFLLLFLEPRTELAVQAISEQADFALFIFSGAVAATLGQAQRAARLKAEAATADLHESNRQLARSQWDTVEALTQLDAFLAHAPVGLAFYDPDLRCVRVNNYLAESGARPPAAGDDRPASGVLTDFPPAATDAMRKALDTGTPFRDLTLRGVTGPDSVWTVSGFPARDPHGVSVGLAVVAQDVTDRVRQEEAVRASEERFRRTADAAPAILWETDPDGRCLFLSRGWHELTGQPEGEGLGFGWLDMTHPDDAGPSGEAFRSANAARGDFRADYRVRRADGSYRWATDIGRPRFGPAGEYLGMVGSVVDIDDRKQAEEAVQASEQRLRTLWQSAPVAVSVSRHGRHLFVNPAFLAQHGLPADADLAGASVLDTLIPAERELVADRVRRRAAGEPVPDVYEVTSVRADGSEFITELRLAPVVLADGPASVCFLSDVTARRQAQDVLERRVAERTAELRREKAFLAAVLESVEDAIVACDADGTLTLFNRATKTLHGLPAEPLPAERWADHYSLFGPDGATPLRRDEVPLYRALAGEEVRNAEMVVAARGAAPRTLLASGRGLFDEDGKRLGAVVSMHDITDRRAAEAARAELVREQTLRQQEERFRLLADAMPQIVYVTKPDTTPEYLNRRWYEYTGLADDSQESIQSVIHPDDRPRVAERYAALAPGGDFEIELRLRHGATGEYRWFLTRSTAVRDAAGAVVNRFGTSTDIHDQKRTEQELRASEAFVRHITDLAPSVLYVFDLGERRNVWANRETFATLGYDQSALDALGGDLMTALLHPDDLAPYRDHAAKLLTLADGQAAEFEYRMKHADGSWRWLVSRDMVFRRDAAGQPTQIVGAALDVTDRKAADEARAASEGRLRLALTAAHMVAWEYDPASGAVALSDNAGEVLGAGGPVATAVEGDAGIHPDDAAAHRAKVAGVVAGGGSYLSLYRQTRADGREVWLEERGHAAAGGRLVGVTVDVTARQRAEAEIARVSAESDRRKRLYEAVLDSTPDLAYVWGLDHRFAYANAGLLRMWGKTWDEAIGRHCRELGYEDWHADMHDREIDQVVATRRPLRGEVPFTGPLGRRIYDYLLVPVVGPDGEVEAVAGITRDVTDQKAAQEQERRQAAELAAVLDAVPAAVWTTRTPDAREITGNRAAAELLRLPAGANQSQDAQSQFQAYHAGRPVETADLPVQRAARGEEVRDYEEEIVFGDGTRRRLLGTATPLRDADGKVYGSVAAFLDVTERMAAEERFRFVRESSGVGFWYCDLPFDVLEWDVRVKEHFHLPTDAVVTIQTFYDRIHPDDREPTRLAIEACIRTRTPYDTVYRTVHPATGEVKHIRAVGRTGYGPDGAPVQFDGITTDVTAARRAEVALRESEANARMALDVARLGTWRMVPADGRVEADARTREVVGLPPAGDVTMADVFPLVHPDDVPRVEAAMRAATDPAGDGAYEVEVRHVHRDGSVRWVSARGLTEFADGQAAVMRGTVLDVTAVKQAADALRVSEERRRMALDAADLGTFNMDVATGRLTVDERFQVIFGTVGAKDYESAVGCIHPDDQERVRAAVLATTRPDDPDPYAIEYRVIHPGGAVRWVFAKGKTSAAEAGKPASFDGTVADITPRKQAEDRQRLLADLAAEMLPLTDPAAVLAAGVRRLRDHLGADRCVYAEADPEAGTVAITAEDLRRGTSLMGRHRLADFGPGAAAMFDAERPFVVADVEADPQLAGFAAAYRAIDVRAMVNTPVRVGGRLVALVAVHTAAPRPWTADEVGLVRQVAARCWETVERLRAGRELAASEARFRGLTDTAPQIVWEADRDGRSTFLSRYFDEFTGVPGTAALGDAERWGQVIRPDQLPRMAAIWAEAVRGAERYEDLYPIRRADGQYRWFQARGRLVKGADGTPDRWVGTATDVHDRVKAEEALAETQRTLTMSLSAANAGVYLWDLAADKVTVRTAHPTSPGVLTTSRPAKYDQWLSRIHPADRERATAAVDAARAARKPFVAQFRTGDPDNGYRWVESRGQFEYAPDGSPSRMVGVRLDIHDRKTAEEAARRADLEFRMMADHIPQMAWMIQPDGHFDWYNSRWYDYTGTTFEEMQGWGWQKVHAPGELDRMMPRWQHALATGTLYEDVFPLRRKDGVFRWFLTRVNPVRDESGAIIRWFGTNTDITEQRQLQAELRAAGERFEFLDRLGQATRESDARGTLAVTARLLGEHLRATRCAYADVAEDGDAFRIPHDWTDGAESTVGDYSLNLFGPRAAADMRAGRPLVIRDVDAELAPRDGADMFNAIGIKAIVCCPLVKGGRLVAMIAVHQATARDWSAAEVGLVTEVVERSWAHVERARAEAEALDSATRFRTLTEAIPQLVWNADADGRVSYVNTRWRQYTGLTGEESGYGWWRKLGHPADLPAADAAWEAAASADETAPVRQELRLRRAADGAYRWFSMAVVPLRRPDGSLDQWIGSLADVHDLKTAEEAVRANEAKFRQLVEAVPTMVWVTDAAGAVVQLNREWGKYSGKPVDALLDDGWVPLVHPDDAAGVLAGWRAAVRQHSAYAGEFRIRRHDGAYRWHVARGVPVSGPDGRLSNWFGTTTDIDDQKRAAELLEAVVKERTAELARSNAELEKFAYVASHDLQEPLRKVQAFGDRLSKKYAPTLGPDGADYVERMNNSAARMQTLINDLLAFSRVTAKPKAFVPVPLGPLVAGVLSDLEALTSRTGAVVRVGELPTVHGDPGQLRQLFQNLVANACKFHKPDQPPTVTLSADRLDGPRPGWRLTVSDDGIGFEQQYADKIFEVFQRLHGRGTYEGTGIGLAICRRIAERHGGIITARGRPGDGAAFAVDLPDPPGDAPP